MPKKLTPDEFQKRIIQINPNIEIIGDYINEHKHMLCRCKKCGLEWSPTPDSLLHAHGCPRCAGNYGRTAESFCREMRIKNPSIEILGQFTKVHEHIDVRCKVCGYVWAPTASSLLSGHGCPKCGHKKVGEANSKVSTQKDSLATVFPDVIYVWNYEKNGLLQPESVRPKSNKYVWWKPELLTEWNYEKNAGINPEYINANSNKRVWWKCKQGHEWQAVVYARVNGSNCPYCTNKKVLYGFNDLATKNPSLAAEWNYEKNGALLPKDVQPGTNKKVWWKCRQCNYEWNALISNRNNGAGCPRCARLRRGKLSERKHK